MADVLGSISLNCNTVSSGGVRRVWVASRPDFGRFFLRETSTLQYATITGSETDGVFFPLYPQPANTSFTVTEELGPVRSYLVSLPLPYNRMDITHRDVFERLATVNNACFAIEDDNGKYWLVGENTDGCRFVQGYNSNGRSGIAQYNLVASCRQRWPLRTIDRDYLEARAEGGSDAFAVLPIGELEVLPISLLTLLQ
jgi:hypothetical protein